MSAVDLSIIVPIFNEEESVVPLWQQTAAAVEKLGKTFEIIFIDDGSTDKSQSVLAGVAAKDFAMLGGQLVGQGNALLECLELDEPAVCIQGVLNELTP